MRYHQANSRFSSSPQKSHEHRNVPVSSDHEQNAVRHHRQQYVYVGVGRVTRFRAVPPSIV